MTVLMTALVGFIGLVFIVTPLAGAANLSIGGPSDCDQNAVIFCGAHSVNKLISDYNGDAYVRKVYRAFGISAADMANLPNTVVMGSVTKSGDVFADGRLVARNAVTGGRQNMPGSTAVNSDGAIFFKRPPSVSFVSSPLPAFVSMLNGRFQFAIIASCGNAAAAVPVTPPKAAIAPARPVSKPKPAPVAPAPTQTQTQTQTQSQQVTVESPAAPAQSQAVAAVPASTLPNTGPGDAVGLFAASSLAGFLGYRRFLLHKLGH